MVFRKMRIVTIFILIIPFQTKVVGQTVHCSKADAERADYEAGRLRTWNKLYHSYLRYSGCDDGSIAEGYSDSIVQILAHHWTTFPQALPLFSSDIGFYKFVLKHIDPTAEPDDLKLIRVNTIRSCPPGANEYCTEIRKAAGKALSEIRIVPPPKSQVGPPR
jgi:hypothetical protein